MPIMASIAFPSLAKKAKLSDGTTYGWVVLAPSLPSKATFLLLHGYPSSCYDWRHQIDGLQKAGYGVIAPDLLGYGDTDKPTDPSAYRTKTMCAHMVEILDIESLDRVIAVGHDWYTLPLFSFVELFHLVKKISPRLESPACRLSDRYLGTVLTQGLETGV